MFSGPQSYTNPASKLNILNSVSFLNNAETCLIVFIIGFLSIICSIIALVIAVFYYSIFLLYKLVTFVYLKITSFRNRTSMTDADPTKQPADRNDALHQQKDASPSQPTSNWTLNQQIVSMPINLLKLFITTIKGGLEGFQANSSTMYSDLTFMNVGLHALLDLAIFLIVIGFGWFIRLIITCVNNVFDISVGWVWFWCVLGGISFSLNCFLMGLSVSLVAVFYFSTWTLLIAGR